MEGNTPGLTTAFPPLPRTRCVHCLAVVCERCDGKHAHLGCVWVEPGEPYELHEGRPWRCAVVGNEREPHEYVCTFHGSRGRWTARALITRSIRQDGQRAGRRRVSV